MTTPAPAAPPPTGSGDGPSGPRASFGIRLGAILIDLIILSIVNVILRLLLGTAASAALSIAINLVYFGYLEGSASGQTVGKKVVGIRVVDFASGGPIGFGRALIRWVVGSYVSTIACLLGHLWMLWDKEKQTWQDKLSTSVVVPTSAYPVSSWPG